MFIITNIYTFEHYNHYLFLKNFELTYLILTNQTHKMEVSPKNTEIITNFCHFFYLLDFLMLVILICGK